MRERTPLDTFTIVRDDVFFESYERSRISRAEPCFYCNFFLFFSFFPFLLVATRDRTIKREHFSNNREQFGNEDCESNLKGTRCFEFQGDETKVIRARSRPFVNGVSR